MNLTLTRFYFTDEYTLGVLESADRKFRCYTCEDTVRPQGVKVQDQTAIGYGTYKVVVDWSQKFGKMMPHILNVQMFTGIRIHKGNGPQHSSGCILVGNTLSISDTLPLGNCDTAFGKLMLLLDTCADKKEEVSLTIVGAAAAMSPPQERAA